MITLDTLRDPAAREDLMSLARTGVSAGHAVTGLQEFIEIGVVDRVVGELEQALARVGEDLSEVAGELAAAEESWLTLAEEAEGQGLTT